MNYTTKAEADKARELALAQQKSDLAWLLAQPQGRRFLRRFFGETQKPPMAQDPVLTAFNLGRQDLARGVLDSCRDADFELWQAAERTFYQEK